MEVASDPNLRPAEPGRFIGRGRLIHRAGDNVHLEASVFDTRGEIISTATVLARIIPLAEAKAAV